MANNEEASAYLVEFLARYTRLLEGQLSNIRETMAETVETVMAGVTGLSSSTQVLRHQAEQVLVDTYVNPDLETEILMQDIQKVADEIFEGVASSIDKGTNLVDFVTQEPEVLVKNRLKRFEGKFGHEMSALTSIDNQLGEILFGIIGALSSEDVISQKIHHVVMSLQILQTGINYILIDFDQRCTMTELPSVISGIKSYSYKQYTAEDEKRRFLALFPDYRDKSA